MSKPNSIYYSQTLTALRNGSYLSPRQMLADMEGYPFFDAEHARHEVLRAVNHHQNS